MSKLRFCIYSTRLNRLLILIRTLRRRIRSKNKAPFTDKLQAGLYFHISIKRLLHHLVRCRVGENHRRLERLGFFKVHQRVGHDNNDVIRLHLTGCRTVQANFARATLALNNVGFKTFTVYYCRLYTPSRRQSCWRHPSNLHQS